MKDKLPQTVLQRPKVGFDIPAHDWLRGPLRSLLVDTLRAGAAEHPDIFRADVIEAHLQDHLERRVNIGYHLWGLMILLLWMKKWKVQGAEARLSNAAGVRSRNWSIYLALLLIAASVYLSGIISPPSLIRRRRFGPGADRPQHARDRRLGHRAARRHRLSGKAAADLLDDGRARTKSSAYTTGRRGFRSPCSALALCLLTAAFGIWAFGRRAGFYAGLVHARLASGCSCLRAC